jgi:hypothetical protein
MEIVDENTVPIVMKGRGRPVGRDWDAWLKHGKTVRLVQGEDFTCKAASLRPQAYNAARARKGTVRVTIGVHPFDAGVEVVEMTFYFTERALKDLEALDLDARRDQLRMKVAEDLGLDPDDELAKFRQEEKEDIRRRIRRPLGPPLPIEEDDDPDIFPRPPS